MNTLTNDPLLEDLKKRVDAYHSQILNKESEPESGAESEAGDEKELRDKAIQIYLDMDYSERAVFINDASDGEFDVYADDLAGLIVGKAREKLGDYGFVLNQLKNSAEKSRAIYAFKRASFEARVAVARKLCAEDWFGLYDCNGFIEMIYRNRRMNGYVEIAEVIERVSAIL